MFSFYITLIDYFLLYNVIDAQRNEMYKHDVHKKCMQTYIFF